MLASDFNSGGDRSRLQFRVRSFVAIMLDGGMHTHGC